ncbi:2,3-diketo-5-methylthio-1-phosphopentane phosphatase [Streptomyces venezuelae]|uniref:acireductone synthase n=1 Tax=Streptomyces gardneri TaxID=66892 RepID=UPI0006BCC895|nr:acireductone synthase [Streptomyces gardneri]ALO06595.1 2,3-diketo-5-methylthio-1-phosphopentane phosphatase [Streptomyces venezuelae]QPK44011.1 acireductone synthase [Streptomyces gardneri]WRK35283.1 acireductone synthase [Streptomyces venezuelae]CUM43129.1 2,3-diketo-5-methylthiopentyl-1-phosphate enolase-phosphatase [Streptomyces venezuelae]
MTGTGRLRAVVLDIEGTTGSLDHVQDVLFPYARARFASWLAAHRGTAQWRRILDAVADEAGSVEDEAGALALLERWADADVKTPPLKTLQGLIWASGYADGQLHGHVYADVPPALELWKARGVGRFVYSSGSVAAQHDWFGHTAYGDLRPLLDGYFDLTTAGPKTSPESYDTIARQLGHAPAALLFVSDLGAELDAAATAGWRTAAVRRSDDDRAAVPGHPAVDSLTPLL